MNDTDASSRAGTRFGHYELRRLIGRGGFGDVYEAEDTVMERAVALKLLNETYSKDPVFRERLQREAKAAGRLHEPHVVSIHGFGEIDGLLYVDMRLIEGTDLHSVLKRFGPMNPARAVAIMQQVASALDAAHATGMVHRDVKPENVLLTDEDFAYLVDFGIANAVSDQRLTQLGTAVGTFAYMAPERFGDGEPNYRVDIYSLACVLFECLTGSRPYRGDSLSGLVRAHVLDAVPHPSAVRRSIPVGFDAVIARGMAKKPEERYPTAGDLAEAAHDALTSTQRKTAETILARSQQAQQPPVAADQYTPAAPSTPGPPTPYPPPAQPMMGGAGSGQPAQPAQPAQPMMGGAGSGQSAPPTYWPPSSGAGQPPVPPSWAPAQQFPPPAPARRNRTPWIIGGIAAAFVVAIVIVVVVALVEVGNKSAPEHPASSSPKAPPGQQVLPFTGLNHPGGALGVDSSGAVYVADNRVLKLAAGSTSQTVLPFGDQNQFSGLAIDSNGAVYVSDIPTNRVLKLAAGTNSPIALPFTGLNTPDGLAVDSSGNVYVTDYSNDRVLKLPAGSTNQTVLPFNSLNGPTSVAVDTAGAVYVDDYANDRVLKLPAGSTSQTVLPFNGLNGPTGLAVDQPGDVYVTDYSNNRVLKLPAGSTSQTELPFTALNGPTAVVVDTAGNVYINDKGSSRVLKLPAQ